MKRKSPKSTLAEVGQSAIWRRLLFDRKDAPGSIIKKLPKEQREILERLKSDDIKDAYIRNQP